MAQRIIDPRIKLRHIACFLEVASLVTLPGINHIEGFDRVDLVAPYVLAFLATVP